MVLNLTRYNETIIYKAISRLENFNPSDFNQGLMELGALICTSNHQNVLSVHFSKIAKLTKVVTQQIIQKKAKRIIPHFNVVTAIIWRGDTFYIQKGVRIKMLGGLWNFQVAK